MKFPPAIQALTASCCFIFVTASELAIEQGRQAAEVELVDDPVAKLTNEQIEKLRGKTLTNPEELRAGVDFHDPSKNPYGKLWYDTRIDYSRNCYVIYEDADKKRYKLKSLNEEEKDTTDAPFGIYLTHKGACGVCSNLDDLYVYLAKPDLTTPVRRCALRQIGSLVTSCLREVGFSEDCSMIWYWNTYNTGRMTHNGGCFGVCFMHIFSPNNQPIGSYNPCKPRGNAVEMEDRTPETLNTLNPNPTATAGELCLPSRAWCKGCCIPKSRQDDGLCGNTINGRPACSSDQWQNGPQRLNPCLQCDECRSGPIFQKVAGRTRRASGIKSAIDRPGVPRDIFHTYG
uniref:Uncharacterized protein n=1 Tax=Mucochytrium quahogii TaxID=96639 RepID=A0A7S2RQZ5_9STRA|mmetsp:Transcript_18184/g.29544  ORF Transcript_18184/g.29544 Transcript_18184/m.29544 type:complete len:344 (+) Transcript_18184:40-1071(+)